MLWEWQHCLLRVPVTLLASLLTAPLPLSLSRERRRSRGRKEPLRGWTLDIAESSKALPKCPEPSWWGGILQGLFHWLDSSSARAGVSAQRKSQAGGTGESVRDRALAVPLTQTTFLGTKTPETGHSSPSLGPAGPWCSTIFSSSFWAGQGQRQGCEVVPRMGIWEHRLERSQP